MNRRYQSYAELEHLILVSWIMITRIKGCLDDQLLLQRMLTRILTRILVRFTKISSEAYLKTICSQMMAKHSLAHISASYLSDPSLSIASAAYCLQRLNAYTILSTTIHKAMTGTSQKLFLAREQLKQTLF